MALLACAITAAQWSDMSLRKTRQYVNMSVQSDNVARAGLTEALNWFRRQSDQPVKDSATPDQGFHPKVSEKDTIDENIGMVKEYALSESTSLWARFELRRQPLGLANDPHAVHDVSGLRKVNKAAGDGVVWSLESHGYVYSRTNAALPFNKLPNRVIAQSTLTTEIERLAINPPPAAVMLNDYGQLTFVQNGRINGGTLPGLAHTTPLGVLPPPNITGSPVAIQSGTPFPSPRDMFGDSISELRAVADISGTSASDLANGFPANGLVVLTGAIQFDDTTKLEGIGILIIDGNLTVAADSNATFNGLIYVNGNAVIYGPATISGALIVAGTLKLDGTLDAAEVEYNLPVLVSVTQQAGQYRLSRTTRYGFSALH